MTKGEKIGSITLGVLLFSGLFYFIFTTMKNPLPTEYGDDFYADSLGEEESEYDADLEADAEEPEVSTAPVTAPGTGAKK